MEEVLQKGGRMEGWLYLISSKPNGSQYSQKRYYILEDHVLKSFKSMPILKEEVPVRSAAIDYCMRITDNGREIIHSKVLFIFTLHNNSNNHDHLKLGASNPEESASWIQSLNDAALKERPSPEGNVLSSSSSNWQKFRLNHFKGRDRSNSIDWTLWSSVHTDLATSDVVASSQWTIFGCQSGLRLFKEAKDRDIHGKHWNDHRAIMAIGVVDGSSEAIFRTLMSLGPSRSEWDFCLCRGSVIERLDGHTDIIHKLLSRECLPRSDPETMFKGMKRRDLLLQRYWRREDDGTYVILYHSVSHEKCRPQKGYVRACIKSGGYVIAPLNQGKQSVVKHMLAIDWKFWKSYLGKSSARSITVRMLGRVAALRELFRAKLGNYPCSDFSLGCIDSGLSQSKEDKKFKVQTLMEENSDVDDLAKQEVEMTRSKSHNVLNEPADEFFDVPEPANCDALENGWSSDCCAEHSQDVRHSKISKSAKFVKKLQDIAVHKKGYKELKGVAKEDSFKFHYGVTLPKDLTGTSACSWKSADPSTFLIRGDRYLNDHQKIKAKGTLMEMVAADWLRSNKREDDLGSRPGSIVQKYAAQGGPEFFFIINIQVPGVTTYGLALYYMTSTPLEDTPLLQSFVNGDDTYRNSRFKLIPNISQGSWIVKQSVGKKACLIGQSLQVNYFRGKNYIELGIDIGSSTVARGVVNLVLGYLNNLVIEMAFLIQANTSEELPEMLLGTCRLNHLDASKSVLIR